jgi:hypothetical protein
VELSERFDVVVGSRLAPGAAVGRASPSAARGRSRLRAAVPRGAARAARDLFCGFKLWRAPAAEAAYRATALTGWTFDGETLAMARALGFRITRPASPGPTGPARASPCRA